MRTKIHFIAGLFALTLLGAGFRAGAQNSEVKEAVRLYEAGMYDMARGIFKKYPEDALCADYTVLCALGARSFDYDDLASKVDENRVKGPLNSQIHREYALLLFDRKLYPSAEEEFAKVNLSGLKNIEKGEYWFKRGYCAFSLEELGKAAEYFNNSVAYPSEYVSAAYFALGVIEYNSKNFGSAVGKFEKSVADSRFEELSAFYLVDCHFMLSEFDYVLDKGPSLYEQMDGDRRHYLARILSETYMVKGDAKNAAKYVASGEMNSGSDYFHAGSVYYAVGDYRKAISYYDKMTDKADSLTQVAAYHKAFSYIKLKNKVNAMACFKRASELTFDAVLQEDAMFNYAKLCFDINGDESAFHSYIKKYGMEKRGEMIYDYLAMSALRNKDYERAVQAYDNIDELSSDQKSNYIKANYLRARDLLDAGSYAASVPYLKAAAYYLPKDDQFGQLCRYTLANSYYVSESYNDAITVYNDLYNLSALDSRAEGSLLPYNLGYCFFKLADYTTAARWFDTYINKGDKLARADALVRRADCDFARKDYRQAARNYKTATTEYPNMNNLYPYYYMGVAYGMDGDRQNRIKALSGTVNASPKAPYFNECVYELGRAYSDVSDTPNAVKAFNLLLSKSKDSEYTAKALLGLGTVKRNSGDYEGSLETYKRLVSRMPKSPYVQDALLSIKSVYTAMKTPEKYIEYLEANKLSTGRTEAEKQDLYFETAEQVFLAGNWQGAVKSFSKYLSMFPDSKKNAEAFYYIAASYKSMGQKEKASDFYRQSLKNGLSGSLEELALMDYASLQYSLQQYDEAYGLYVKLTDAKYSLTNKADAYAGAMRSAYRTQQYENTISAAMSLLKMSSSPDVRREAKYLQAKSCLATSQRDKAFPLLGELIVEPNTAEGAEAYYLIIQARFDWGNFDGVEKGVFDFAEKNTDQPYWLAKAFIVLGDSYLERDNRDQAEATYISVRDGYTPSTDTDDILELVNSKLNALQ